MQLVSKEKIYYNYLYAHPLTGNIFYVGKGCKNRLYDHLVNVKKHKLPNKNNYFLYKQIKSLLEENMEPIILQIAEFGNSKDAFSNEVKLIQTYKNRGHKLYNLTDGGEGFSSEFASAQMIKRWEDKYYRERRSKKVSEQSKARWSNLVYKDKVRKKISEGLTNNPKVKEARITRWTNPTYRNKMCKIMKDKWQEPEYVEKMKLRNKKMIGTEYRDKMSDAIKEVWRKRREGLL